MKINCVRDAMLIKTCRVQAGRLPYKFFAAVLDVLRECVWNLMTYLAQSSSIDQVQLI